MRAAAVTTGRLRGARSVAFGVALAAILVPPGLARASAHTVAECFEGAEFVGNAALARDNGMTRAAFLARLEEDLVMIRAYPPLLRWFAKDPDDERLLQDAVVAVFDAPRRADVHRARFLEVCLGNTTI